MGDHGVENPRRARGKQAVRCVVLSRLDGEACEPLLRALRAREVILCRVEDLPAVLVELAAAPSGALFIDESAVWPGLDRLMAAVRKYYPAVVCRRYTARGADGGPRIAPFTDEPAGDSPRAHVEPETEASGGPIPIPAPGQHATPGLRSGVGDLAEDNAAPLVSKEELAMLLGLNGAETDHAASEEGS